jgi:hypothetical protein
MSKDKETTEQKTAAAILQKPITVKIGKDTYDVPRPTLGTIIEISGMIAEYADTDFDDKSVDPVAETLRIAKEYNGLERIIAMIVLGAKAAKREIKLFGRTIWRSSRLERLAKKVREEMTPREITEALVAVFSTMDCAFFLITITTLHRVNHLKATNQTTQSGQPPQAS